MSETAYRENARRTDEAEELYEVDVQQLDVKIQALGPDSDEAREYTLHVTGGYPEPNGPNDVYLWACNVDGHPQHPRDRVTYATDGFKSIMIEAAKLGMLMWLHEDKVTLLTLPWHRIQKITAKIGEKKVRMRCLRVKTENP